MKVEIGTIFIHRGHEVIVKDTGIDEGKVWLTIEPTGNYGFPIDVWYEQVKDEIKSKLKFKH